MSTVVTVLAVVDFLIYGTFVVLYARRRWWTSQTGRIVMTIAAPLAVLFALRAFNLTFVTIPDAAWAAGYALLGAGGAGLLWLLLHDAEKET